MSVLTPGGATGNFGPQGGLLYPQRYAHPLGFAK